MIREASRAAAMAVLSIGCINRHRGLSSGSRSRRRYRLGSDVVVVDNGCRSWECTVLLEDTGNLNEP